MNEAIKRAAKLANESMGNLDKKYYVTLRRDLTELNSLLSALEKDLCAEINTTGGDLFDSNAAHRNIWGAIPGADKKQDYSTNVY